MPPGRGQRAEVREPRGRSAGRDRRRDRDQAQPEIDAEIEIKLNALKEQKGKLPPEQALVGIKKGMASKFCTQICLVKQDYVADGEQTVEQYLASVAKEVGAPITVKRFVRLQLGA